MNLPECLGLRLPNFVHFLQAITLREKILYIFRAHVQIVLKNLFYMLLVGLFRRGRKQRAYFLVRRLELLGGDFSTCIDTVGGLARAAAIFNEAVVVDCQVVLENRAYDHSNPSQTSPILRDRKKKNRTYT